MILTCVEGTHGWAVTKLISFSSAYVCSLATSVSTSVTVKVTLAAYVWICGGWVTLLTSDMGVTPWSSVGVVWTDSTGAQRLRDLSSMSRIGGALSL